MKAWTRAGRGRAHGSCSPPPPTHTLALPRRARRLGAQVREFKLKGAGASQPKKEAGICRTVRATRLTFPESLKETLRSHPVAHSLQASAWGAGCGSSLFKLQSRVPPSTPRAHPRALAPAVLPSGRSSSPSSPHLVPLSLSHNLRSPQNGPSLGTPPHHVAPSGASHSGHFACIWGFVLGTSVSPSGHELRETGCLLLSA